MTERGSAPAAFAAELETLNVSGEGGVLVAEIAAPPMNLLGPDPDYFISHGELTRVSEYRAEAAKLTSEICGQRSSRQM